MNQNELVFLLLVELLLLVYLRWTLKSRGAALALAILSVIPIYLSLEMTSQFLTVDEEQINESLYISLPDYSPNQWLRGLFRTTDVLFGPLGAILLKYFPQMATTQIKILFKNLHWLTGFIILLWMYHLLKRHFVVASHSAFYFIIFIYTALLLPTNNLALKIFYQDPLVLLLGVMAILYLILAIKNRNRIFALFSIVLAFLAAQEKLNAFPILILSWAVYGYLSYLLAARFKYIKLVWSLLLAIAITLLTSAVFMLIIAGLRNWNVPEEFWQSTHYPLTAWGGTLRFITEKINFGNYYPLQTLALTLLITCLLAAALLLANRFLTKNSSLLMKFGRSINNANIGLAILVLVIGIVSTYYVQAYLAPHFPIESGQYQPSGKMNDTIVHFAATSRRQHIALYIGHSYAAFVNSMPSVYWLGLAGAFIVSKILHREQKTSWDLELLLTLALLMPLAFALAQMPVGGRYFNIGLFLTALVISFKVTEAMTNLSPMKNALFCALFVTALILEVLPFRPLYAPFRPIWSNHYSNTPEAGKPIRPWPGWGEEVMLAGKILEKQCHASDDHTLDGVPCVSLTLATLYGGDWLDLNQQISTIQGVRTSLSKLPLTAANYYIINRACVVQKTCPFPAEVDPAFVINFRGFIQAWIFRGDQLRAAGYEFIRHCPTDQRALTKLPSLNNRLQAIPLNSLPAELPPVSCNMEPAGEFRDLWHSAKALIGCPQHIEPLAGEFIETSFEKGRMFWPDKLDPYGDFRLVIATYGGQELGACGNWEYYPEDWQPELPEFSCSPGDPPPGKFQPKFGIGQVWCMPGVFDRIGWAITPEYKPEPKVSLLQNFEKAVILRDSEGYEEGLVYVLFHATGEYIRLPYQGVVTTDRQK